jgi:hypothetical protein
MLNVLCSSVLPLLSQDIAFKSTGSKATLVELYSSEGCSSCPLAEAWVSALKTSPGLWSDLFPVVFHVDYWDGLGWPDRFAQPAYTQRQRDYAARLGQDSVYTPEFIVNGREWRGWFQDNQLSPDPDATSGELTLSIKSGGKETSARYTPAAPAASQSYMVHVALLGLNIVTDVKAGENGGRQLQHDFIVLAFASQPMALAKAPDDFESGPLDLASSTSDRPGAVVAWITAADGSLVQITGGWIKPQ